MSNPIQQAIEALEMARRFVYADNRPQCEEAIAALQSLQGVELPEPVAWLYENHAGGVQAFTNEPPPRLKELCKALYTADQLRTAVAAAMARGAVPQGWQEALKLKMEWSAWDGTLQLGDALANIDEVARQFPAAPTPEATQPDVEDTGARCEPSDWVPPAGYDGDGSVEAMARRATQPTQAEPMLIHGVPVHGLLPVDREPMEAIVKAAYEHAKKVRGQPTQAEAPSEREAAIEEAFESARFALLRPNSLQSMAHIMDVLHCRVQDVFHQRVAAFATQQAEPSIPKELDVRTILLDVVPGEDGMGEEVYAKSVADVEAMLGKMGEELEDWQLGIRRYATQQAVQAEPAAWREHVEQRIRTWRQRTMNRSGDRLAIDDFMGQDSIDDLVDFVCDEYATPPAPGQVERDREDAERYRFIRDNPWRGSLEAVIQLHRNAIWDREIDAAIRAARSSEGGA